MPPKEFPRIANCPAPTRRGISSSTATTTSSALPTGPSDVPSVAGRSKQAAPPTSRLKDRVEEQKAVVHPEPGKQDQLRVTVLDNMSD